MCIRDRINASEAREDDETFKNPVDVMFDELEARDPDHFAVKQYRKYKLAAGKTAKSILISCGARLAPFDIAELRELMSYDEMEPVSYTHLWRGLGTGWGPGAAGECLCRPRRPCGCSR